MGGPVSCEVCVDSLAGVRAAADGGADRIELCGALELGGLTPSVGLMRAARRATSLPIFAMLRVRPGDFVVDRQDLEVVMGDLAAAVGEGADGLVFGALDPDGAVLEAAVAEVLAAAGHLPVTFHRAVDVCRDPVGAVDVLLRLGVPRVLTSGGAATAIEGADTIRSMRERVAGRMVVMAGSGVRSGNVVELVAGTGVAEVHLSAGRTVRGPAHPLADRRCSFAAPGRSDEERRETDVDEVRRVVDLLRP